MNRFYISAMLVMLAGLLSVSAQQADTAALQRYNRLFPQEKMYVHFDRSGYSPGDTVWFKFYLQSSLGDAFSKVAYLNWFDENGKSISRNVTPVYQSSGWGNFTIPESYSGSQLHVLAYTQWMLNFDSSFLFRKSFPVAQSASQKNTGPASPAEAKIDFLPEGGEMVATLVSRVAFKAVNADGKPINISGIITDQNNKTVCNFISEHDGMGSFSLQPGENMQYTAIWPDEKGRVHHTALPSIRKSGVVFFADKNSLDCRFQLQATDDLVQQQEKLQLVVHHNQQLLFQAGLQFNGKKILKGSIPLSRFPSGVAVISVLDSKGMPLAERVIFVNNEEYIPAIDIRADTIGTGKREKNIFTILNPDSVAANLSVSVVTESSRYDSTQNLVSALLLSSDIRGTIHNPAYYFSSSSDTVAARLDLVMLTNGWRKFRWEMLHKNSLVKEILPFSSEEEFISLSATVHPEKGAAGMLKKAKLVNLFFEGKDSSRSVAAAPLIDNSWFTYPNLLLFDTTKVYYKLDNDALKGLTHVEAQLSALPYQPQKMLPQSFREMAPAPLSQEARIAQAARSFGKMTLEEVKVQTRIVKKNRNEELNDQYTSGMFKSGDATILNLVDDDATKMTQNIFTYLQSKVPGLRVQYNDGRVLLISRGSNTNSLIGAQASVAVMLNEMQIAPERLLDFSISDIAMVKVFRPPFLGVPLGNSGIGAIAVYTKKGQDAKPDIKGMDNFTISAYTPIRDFYSPDYASSGTSLAQTDFRKTLFWKPDLFVEEGQKTVSIRFYNNDAGEKFRVILEGVTNDGKLVHISRRLE